MGGSVALMLAALGGPPLHAGTAPSVEIVAYGEYGASPSYGMLAGHYRQDTLSGVAITGSRAASARPTT
jgi:hypothetical protein